MKQYCPSCGSQVDESATTCSVCGEDLAASTDPVHSETAAADPIVEPVTRPIAAAMTDRPASDDADNDEIDDEAGIDDALTDDQKMICQDCGAAHQADATECSVCGGTLISQATAKARAAERPRPTAKRSSTRDYLLAAGAAVVLGAVVYLVATPEARMAPAPADAAGQAGPGESGDLPAGHPPLGAQLTPAQEAELASLKEQVENNPKDTAMMLQLAHILFEIKRYDEALPYYRRYVESNPGSLDARTFMASAMFATNDAEGAISVLRKVLSEKSDHQGAAYNLAVAFARNGQPDSAMHWFRRVIRIDSTSVLGQDAVQIIAGVENDHNHDHEGHDHPADSAH